LMDQKYAAVVARATDRSVSSARQSLRALRENGFVPGYGANPSAVHVTRIVMAMSADTVKEVPERVAALRRLPLRSPAELPGLAETMIELLVDVFPTSPVLADFDLDGGSLHLGASSVTLEVLTLSGKRACVRYGTEPSSAVRAATIIPLATIRKLAIAIKDSK
ncbi:hypothetical protein AB4144_42670, partial [Rhizobiaceae sp. 2RAB30]